MVCGIALAGRPSAALGRPAMGKQPLMYLLNAVGIVPHEKPGKFITRLSEASIPTRYPEDLARVQQVFTEGVVRDILAGGKEAIAWIRAQLSR